MNKNLTAFMLATTLLGPAVLHAADTVAMTPQQQQLLGVTTAPLVPAGSVAGQTLPGRVMLPPEQARVLSAPQSGLVVSLDASSGDRVHKGQALAHLDSPDWLEMQRAYLQTYSRARLARAQLNRDETLFKEGIIALRRLEETRAAHAEAVAALQERRHALTLAGLDARAIASLERTRHLNPRLTVTAPADGVVLERSVSVGERVAAASVLYRLGDPSRLWVEIRSPLELAHTLKIGSSVELPGTDAEARLSAIGQDVDPGNQTVLLRAEVTTGADKLRPGQFVEVRVAAPASAEQYRVPAAAVIRSGERTVVFVATADGFRAVPVQVHGQQADTAVITGDLPADAKVAVAGLAAIKAAWQGLGGGE